MKLCLVQLLCFMSLCLDARFIASPSASLHEVTDGPAATKFYVFEGAIVIRAASSGLVHTDTLTKSCLQIVLGDHFNDGWGTAHLRIERRDYPQYFIEYAPNNTMVFPISFRYCPYNTSDVSAYQFRIRYLASTPFKWEASYQVYVEATGMWYHGDFDTRMVFAFDSPSKHTARAFHLVSISNELKPLSCRVCTAIAVQSWIEQQTSGGDSWLELQATNVSFFISDPAGLVLYSYGFVCTSGGSYVCIQTLKDGQYLLRAGSGYGLPSNNSNHVRLHYNPVGDTTALWRLCDISGSLYTGLYFNISAGMCNGTSLYSV